MAGVSVQTSKNEVNCPDIMLLYAASTVLIGASTLKTHWESSSICHLKSSAFLGSLPKSYSHHSSDVATCRDH